MTTCVSNIIYDATMKNIWVNTEYNNYYFSYGLGGPCSLEPSAICIIYIFGIIIFELNIDMKSYKLKPSLNSNFKLKKQIVSAILFILIEILYFLDWMHSAITRL